MTRLAMCPLLLTALALNAQPAQPGRGINLYTHEKKAALGAHLAKEFRQHTTPLDNPDILSYVEATGRRIAAQLPNAPFPYTFAVIADDPAGPPHEPLSFPGGYIFVPANLILAARNEAEFAGILAVAMAHIAERHGTRQATRVELAHNTRIPLIFMGGSTGMGTGANAPAVPLGFISMFRRYELEADALALKTMSAGGYDPEALAAYIAREQPVPDTESARPYSTLPPLKTRLAAIAKTIQQLLPRSYTSSDAGFLHIQAETRRLLEPRLPQTSPPRLDRIQMLR